MKKISEKADKKQERENELLRLANETFMFAEKIFFKLKTKSKTDTNPKPDGK